MRRAVGLITILFVCLFALFACHQKASDSSVVINHSLEKSRKISSCKSKLMKAEKNLDSAEKDLATSQEKLFREELMLIKKDLLAFESSLEKIAKDPQKYSAFLREEVSGLFLKEREELIAIMRSENAVLAGEAGETLDHILRIITKLSTQRSDKI
jgi:hypothetical protein